MNNKGVAVERRVGAGVGVYAVLGFWLGWGLVSILTLTLKQHSLKKKKDPDADSDPVIYWHP